MQNAGSHAIGDVVGQLKEAITGTGGDFDRRKKFWPVNRFRAIR